MRSKLLWYIMRGNIPSVIWWGWEKPHKALEYTLSMSRFEAVSSKIQAKSVATRAKLLGKLLKQEYRYLNCQVCRTTPTMEWDFGIARSSSIHVIHTDTDPTLETSPTCFWILLIQTRGETPRSHLASACIANVSLTYTTRLWEDRSYSSHAVRWTLVRSLLNIHK